MNKEQKKAELLDWLISHCNKPCGKDYALDLLVETVKKYLNIVQDDTN